MVKRTTVNLPAKYREVMDKMIEDGLFPSYISIIRVGIRMVVEKYGYERFFKQGFENKPESRCA